MRLAMVFCALAAPVGAQTDFGALEDAERAAFGAEIRSLLLEEPAIVGAALAQPNYAAQAYQQEADDDLRLLATLSAQILDGADIALFIAPGCGDCAAAQSELQDITKTSGATFILHDITTPQGATLAEKLGMTDAPFYVMPKMILRGHMPAVVLTRYLTQTP